MELTRSLLTYELAFWKSDGSQKMEQAIALNRSGSTKNMLSGIQIVDVDTHIRMESRSAAHGLLARRNG